MSLTIKELSQKSGYSVSTISRVLTNKGSVKESTRRAVEKFLIENNYRSGAATVRVAHTTQKMILVVVNDIFNQFYLETIHSIQATVHAKGYLSLIGISDNLPELEEQYICAAQSASLAGVLLMTPVETEPLRQLLLHLSCPVVLINRYIRSMDLDVICIDNYRGGYMATQYLLNHGLHRLCHVAGHQNSTASQDRRRGFVDALMDFGISTGDENIFQGDMKRSGGQEFANCFLRNHMDYDGVFFANDMMAAGFLDVIQKSKLSVPKDVSVICFDDSPVVTEGSVKLTTISMDAAVLGNQAAEILLRKIGGKQEICKLIFPPSIVERDSVKKMMKD